MPSIVQQVAVLAAAHFLAAVCDEGYEGDSANHLPWPDRPVWSPDDYEYEVPMDRLSTVNPAAATTDGNGKFVDEAQYGGKMSTDLKFLPDGRLLAVEKRGKIKLYDPNDANDKDGAPYMNLGLTPGINGFAERGLLGIGASPACSL